MPNAPEPDRDGTETRDAAAGKEGTGSFPLIPDDTETETVVISKADPVTDPEPSGADAQPERRFTAPGFDAKETQVIATAPEPATEVFQTHHAPPAGPPPIGMPPKTAVPQSIPPRDSGRPAALKQRNWGWVLAIVVIVLALAAIAILGTVLLTRNKHPNVSQEDRVRQTIQHFDAAVQTGDLTALRSITCGTTRDGYVDYDERSWDETYRRVSAAKQYPVIASIDQVVVNGQHAEANITTFMAYDPQVRSTRSLDLQFRDDQWKICQSPSS
ncbi:Rv0361 family membrane protein [Mycobacterium marinum]|uniref:Rv0361 family membrane protein n=1 Tax=Mycobacterium marinum TaxID=1781 RepID=UPI003567296E